MKSRKSLFKYIYRGPGGSIYTGCIFKSLPKIIKKNIYKIRFIEKLNHEIKNEIYKKSDKNLVAFDCGGNVGIWTDILIEFGFKVITFEPNKECYAHLIEKYIDNDNVIIENVALSDYEGRNSFKSESGYSQGGSLQNEILEKKQINEDIVEIKKLSDYIKKFKPSIVKIDIEGEEAKVIKELLNSLDNEEISKCFFAVETHERKIKNLNFELNKLKNEIKRRNIEKNFNFNWL
jgi:FkbM family methyltransferase